MKKLLIAVAIIMANVLVLAADQDTAMIIEVVDAGTMRVEYQGLEEMLRLIGIEMPATPDNEEEDGNQDADALELSRQEREAKEFVQTLVRPGDKITLEFDVEPRDRDNRLLAYVLLPDNTMLNSVILLKGYATPVSEPPNVKYAGQFTWAARNARNSGRGLWKYRTREADELPPDY